MSALLQIGNQLSDLSRLAGAIRETEAPQLQNWLAAQAQIAGAGGYAELAAEVLPVPADVRDQRLGRRAGYVVSNEEHALRGLGCCTNVADHVVAAGSALGIIGAVIDDADEPLHRYAIDLVLGHPAEVREHQLLVLRREQPDGRAVRCVQLRSTQILFAHAGR